MRRTVLIGSDHADVLTGNNLDNFSVGNNGDDTLSGGGGNDNLLGGDGADTIDGGAGEDVLRYDNSLAGVTVTLGVNGAQTIGQGGEAQGDKIKNCESIGGSGHDDVLTGNNLDNSLLGGDGIDTLDGNSGNDFLFGGNGDDTLTGGTGVDTFLFVPGFGHDVIMDLEPDAGLGDIIQFDATIFADFAAVTAASMQVGPDVVITASASDTITLKNVTLGDLSASDFSFF